MSVKEILIIVALVGAAASAANLDRSVLTSGKQSSLTARKMASTDAVKGEVAYTGCNEVRAAGKAPLYAGQPGYHESMDGDRDGIACEPHRRRRR